MSLAQELMDATLPLSGKVAVIGSANVDLAVSVDSLPLPGEVVGGDSITASPGGRSLNHALGCALLGAPTSFIGAVGADRHGRFLLESMEEVGINTDHVAQVPAPTATAFFTVDPQAQKTLVVSEGANALADRSVVDAARSTIKEADAVGVALEIPLEGVIHAARLAREAGSTTVLTPSPLATVPPRELSQHIDVVVLNEKEIELMVGPLEGDWVAAANRLQELGLNRAVISLGALGALVLENGIERIPPIPAQILDQTGGDEAFAAGILASLASGHSLDEAARFACLVSAYAATRRGASASFGTPQEIAQHFERTQGPGVPTTVVT